MIAVLDFFGRFLVFRRDKKKGDKNEQAILISLIY